MTREHPEPDYMSFRGNALARWNRQHERNSMSAADIDEKIVKTILEAVERRGTVQRSDLLRTNIPPASIDARFKACMAIAKDREPKLSHMLTTWA